MSDTPKRRPGRQLGHRAKNPRNRRVVSLLNAAEEAALDAAVEAGQTTRSAFIRAAIDAELKGSR